MPKLSANSLLPLAAWLIATAMAVTALNIFWLSRYQPIEWDLAMMHYIAFLINEKGFILYRDIFENNFPGAFMFQAMLAKFVGYEALPLRVVDFLILSSLAVLAWLLLAPLSKPAAILAPSFFAALYLSNGSYVFLQRDYIAILPVALAATILIHQPVITLRHFIIAGALCGFSCGFKPNCIIAFPVLFWIASQNAVKASLQQHAKRFLCMSLAFTAIFAIPFIWGIKHCDFAQFIYIYKTFTPIYVNSRIDLFHYSSTQEHLTALFNSQLTQLKYFSMTCLPGLVWASLNNSDNPANRKRIKQLAITTFAFVWYELMAGKYWFAHLLPPYFWYTIGFSLLLCVPRPGAVWWKIALCIAAFGWAIVVSHYIGSYSLAEKNKLHYTAENSDLRSQKIARYLKSHLQPGDTVQGIDGSGDGQGSLLLARATPATRFLEDIPLYMQPDAPATQEFRREFLDSLAQKPPAYIVYIHNFWHPAGGNRLKEFKALYAFIQAQYDEVELDDGQYTIYRRKNLAEKAVTP